MRTLLLIIALLGSSTLFAQTQANNTNPGLVLSKNNIIGYSERGKTDSLTLLLAQSLTLKANRMRVLPQDHMPCIMPDSTILGVIPNATTITKKFKTTMPNGADK